MARRVVPYIPKTGTWKTVAIDALAVFIILVWLVERKHKVVFSAVDKNAICPVFRVLFSTRHDHLKEEWNVAAYHILLSIQRCHHEESNYKVNTVFECPGGPQRRRSSPTSVPNRSDGSDEYYDPHRGNRRRSRSGRVDTDRSTLIPSAYTLIVRFRILSAIFTDATRNSGGLLQSRKVPS